MQDLASLLGKKYKYELRYFRAVEIIDKHWPDLVKELARFLFPKNIYKNELVIECNNPIWMSEIDRFSEQIVTKVNQLLSKHRVNLKIKGLKPMFNAQLVYKDRKKERAVPQSIEERIRWNVQNKKKEGAQLCRICQKMWDTDETCRLCRLTGH